MVDRAVVARQLAAVRDAVARVREVLPPSVDAFEDDRTAREVVVLNLFVGIQTCVDLATHWLADEGWGVPQGYAEIFLALADHDVVSSDLARRLVAAAGLRDLIAHQYGRIDWARVYATAASPDLADLEAFCAALATRAR